jgi:hypothetical protein
MQQLVLQFPARDMADYDAVIEVEELLIGGLGDRAEVDGHDVGLGAMNVFIWAENATATFAAVRELLADHPLGSAFEAGYTERDADDDYTPLWPEGLERFDLL